MTLLISAFAAIVSTIIWYVKAPEDNMKISVLCFIYWGATLMWLVDAVAEYLRVGAEYFTPAAGDMLNDAYLGFSAVALGLMIWLVILMVKDPQGKIRAVLSKNKQ